MNAPILLFVGLLSFLHPTPDPTPVSRHVEPWTGAASVPEPIIAPTPTDLQAQCGAWHDQYGQNPKAWGMLCCRFCAPLSDLCGARARDCSKE